MNAKTIIENLTASKPLISTSILQLTLQFMNVKTIIGNSTASKPSTNTSTSQLMIQCTSVTSATGGLAVLKLCRSATNFTPRYTSAMSVIDHFAASMHLNSLAHIFECDDCDRSFGNQQSLEQHLLPWSQFQNAIIPLEIGSPCKGCAQGCDRGKKGGDIFHCNLLSISSI